MSGENLHIFLGNLGKYFTQLPPAESLKEIVDTDLEQIKQRSENDFTGGTPELYTILQQALTGSDCCDLLQDIYNDASNSRKEQGTLSITHCKLFSTYFLQVFMSTTLGTFL